MLFIGTAEKDGEVIDFSLGIELEVAYLGGDFVGDIRKGILSAGDSAEVEMTFHLDHFFGRDDKDPDDPMNLEAFGFGPLAELAVDGSVVVDLADLETALNYARKIDGITGAILICGDKIAAWGEIELKEI